MGREVRLDYPPRRVISLVPSLTEYLIDLGVNVVGRTKFCVHPADKVRGIPVIGGTKNFRFEAIHKLQPDLIIGNQEENYQEGIGELSKMHPVWMTRIITIPEMLGSMLSLGELVERPKEARSWILRVEQRLSAMENTRSGRVLYLIWKDPWMAAGRETFIHSMLMHLGHENAVSTPRYPELMGAEIKQLDPEVVMLSSEPFPFREKHLNEVSEILPGSHVELVDGEGYSWYGSRIAKV